MDTLLNKRLLKIILFFVITLGVLMPKVIAMNEIESSEYTIVNDVISRIEPGTDLHAFIEALNIESENIHIYEDNTCTKEITTGYIGTGMALKTDGDEKVYTLSVIGDFNKDSKISQIELTQLIRHILEISEKKLEGPELVSADITNDDKVNQIDVTALIRYIVFGKLSNKVPSASGSISIIPSTTEWTNKDMTVEITTENENFKVQYSEDGENWTEYTEIITVTENKTIYARFYNGTEGGNYTRIVITNIDKTLPTGTIQNVPESNSIQTLVNAIDDLSGIAEYKFYIGEDEENYILKDTNTLEEYEFSDLEEETIYYIKVEIIDNAGNIYTITTQETTLIDIANINPNFLFTHTPTIWTNQDVSLVISTEKTDFSVQYDDGTGWNIYSNPIIVTTNKPIVARLWNGTTGGMEQTATISNIDKVLPAIADLTVVNIALDSIELSVNVNDADSGIGKIEWYYKTGSNAYESKVTSYADINGSVAGITTPTTKTETISGLTDNTEYDIYAKVYDVAGNYAETSITNTATAKIPENYIITYNANGGTGAPIAQTKVEDADLTLSSTKPIYAGYIFLGWSTDSSSNIVEYNPGDIYTVNADLTLYAVWAEAVAGVNNVEFAALQSAINSVVADTTETVVILKDITENVVIANNQSVKFNLGDHTITGQITNNGDLTLNTTGTITSSDVTLINNGTLVLSESTISTTGTTALDNAGTLQMTGGKISGNDGNAICNRSTGTITISGGIVTSKAINNAIINNVGTATISGGTVSAENESIHPAIQNVETLTIMSGTVAGNTGIAIHNETTGTAILNAGEITSTATADGGVIYNEGTCTLGGATVRAVSTTNTKAAIYNSGELEISAGTIDGGAHCALVNYNDVEKDLTGNVTISGGMLKSTTLNGAVVYNVIGEIDISGTATKIIRTGEESENSSIYNKEGGTINLLNGTVDGGNGYSVYNDMDSYLNMSGGKITSTAALVSMPTLMNKGTIVMTDGIIESTLANSNVALANYGIMEMKGGNVKTEASNRAALSNMGTFTLQAGIIDGPHLSVYNDAEENQESVFTMKGGTIPNGVYSVNGGLVLSNGTINRSRDASTVYSEENLKISGATINGYNADGATTSYPAVCNMGTGEITSGTITSQKHIAVLNYGTITMSGGDVTSNATSVAGFVNYGKSAIIDGGTITTNYYTTVSNMQNNMIISGGAIIRNKKASLQRVVAVYNNSNATMTITAEASITNNDTTGSCFTVSNDGSQMSVKVSRSATLKPAGKTYNVTFN